MAHTTAITAPRYTCVECGTRCPRWFGRCAQCGAWNTCTADSAVADSPAEKARDALAELDDAREVVGRLPILDTSTERCLNAALRALDELRDHYQVISSTGQV